MSDSSGQTKKPSGYMYLITEDDFPEGFFDVNWREIFKGYTFKYDSSSTTKKEVEE